jgi:hypothetical protein
MSIAVETTNAFVALKMATNILNGKKLALGTHGGWFSNAVSITQRKINMHRKFEHFLIWPNRHLKNCKIMRISKPCSIFYLASVVVELLAILRLH